MTPFQAQKGAALLLLVIIMLMAATYTLIGGLSTNALRIEHNAKTSEALAQAKEALIAYAASVDLSTGRPGDLPCPDRDNDGKAGTTAITSCGSAGGNNQARRLSRLPWKDLGLPELRDASGELLWYAVSNNFKRLTRTACTSPGQTGCLNSGTSGTITVRDAGGNILFNGNAGTGVVAVIIAPGAPITRQDGIQQSRTTANVNNPQHYLDNIATEDNDDFVDSSPTNGFFAGPVYDASGSLIANDRIVTITRDEIMAAIERRVAREAFNCLRDYALDADTDLNKQRLPWAADITASAGGNYSDTTNTRFGRLPDSFSNTVASSGGNPMKNGWTTSCNLNLGTWWNNWKDVVFYVVADAYKPQPTPFPTCGACLTITPPATADKPFAIFVASARLSGQSRTSALNKRTITNYLEGENATTSDDVFSKASTSAIFNDYVLYQ